MDNKFQLLLEAEKRGILPENKKALLQEARNRGLIENEQERTLGGFAANIPSSAKKLAEGIATQYWQSAANVGNIAKDVLTGQSVRQLMGAGGYEGTPVGSALESGGIAKTLPEMQQQAEVLRQDYAKSYASPEAIKQTAYEDPFRVAADVAMLLGAGGLAKRAVGAKPKMVETSKILAGKLEDSTLKNIASNKHVRENVSVFAPEDLENVAARAADKTERVLGGLKQAENYVYKRAGITDDMAVPVERQLPRIEKMVSDFASKAVGDNVKVGQQAMKVVQEIKSKTQDGKVTSFGTLKDLAQQVYDLAEANKNIDNKYTSAGVLYKKLGNELSSAKKSLPKIKEAGAVFSDLRKAEKQLSNLYRLKNIDTPEGAVQEANLSNKILNRYKDVEHGAGKKSFKSQVEDVNKVIKKHKDLFAENPETKDIVNKYGNADFADEIKLAQSLKDIATKGAKPGTLGGLEQLPIIGKPLGFLGKATKLTDPTAKAVRLKNLIDSGLIDPQAIMGEVRASEGLLLGRPLTTARAYKSILPAQVLPMQNRLLSAIARGEKEK